MSEPRATGIFLSYRREDTRHVAGRLFDRLVERFGRGNVFMDVDSIEPGLDFTQAIEVAVGQCQILLALIGESWITAVDEYGRRRLEDPDDLVVLEIKAALDRGVRVVPILVDGASAPRRVDLPTALAPLARRNAVRVDHETFYGDVEMLLAAVDRATNSAASQSPSSTSSAVEPGVDWAVGVAGDGGPASVDVALTDRPAEFSSVERLSVAASGADRPAGAEEASGTSSLPLSLPRAACVLLATTYVGWALLSDEPELPPLYVALVILVAAAGGLVSTFLERSRSRPWVIAIAVCCGLVALIAVVAVLVYNAPPSATSGANLLMALVNLTIFSVNGGLLSLVGMRSRMRFTVPRRGLLLTWSAAAGLGLLLEYVLAVSGQVMAARSFEVLGLYISAVVLLIAAVRRDRQPGASAKSGDLE